MFICIIFTTKHMEWRGGRRSSWAWAAAAHVLQDTGSPRVLWDPRPKGWRLFWIPNFSKNRLKTRCRPGKFTDPPITQKSTCMLWGSVTPRPSRSLQDQVLPRQPQFYKVSLPAAGPTTEGALLPRPCPEPPLLSGRAQRALAHRSGCKEASCKVLSVAALGSCAEPWSCDEEDLMVSHRSQF